MAQWLSGWKYRKKHEINGSAAGAVTDYQIRVKVHYGSGADNGEDVYLNSNCRADFGDVRFTADDGVTELAYWMEEKVDGDYAVFWVKVPNIPADPNKAIIYIYYGNPDATYAGSGEDTFLFFDDFEDGVLDTNKWALASDYPSGASVTEHDGMLDIYLRRYPYSVQDFPDPIAIEMKVKKDADVAYWVGVTRFDGNANPDDYYNPYNGIAFLMNESSEASQLRKYVEGSKTVLYDSGVIDWPENTWMRVTFKDGKDQYNSYCYVNGTLYAQTSDSTVYTTNHVSPGAAHQETASHLYVEWLAVRKYVEPEPAHGDWYPTEAYQELSETISITDLKASKPQLLKTESLTISDVYSRKWSVYREYAETLYMLDLPLSKTVSITRIETISLTDLVTAFRTLIKVLEETLSLTDKITKTPLVVKTESITLTDVIQKLWKIYRTYFETLSLTDRVSKMPSRTRTEFLNLSDLISKTPSLVKTESITLTDQYSKVWTIIRELEETINLIDIINKKPARTLQELLQLSDLIQKQPQKVLTELQPLIDSILKAIWKILVVEEFPIVYRPYVSREMVKRAIIRGNRYQREIIPAN